MSIRNLILEGLAENRLSESEDFVVNGPDFKNDYCVYVHNNPRVKPRYFKDLSKAEAYAKKKLKDLNKSKTNKLIPGYTKLVIAQGDKIIKDVE